VLCDIVVMRAGVVSPVCSKVVAHNITGVRLDIGVSLTVGLNMTVPLLRWLGSKSKSSCISSYRRIVSFSSLLRGAFVATLA
jgi:hypothetical protein